MTISKNTKIGTVLFLSGLLVGITTTGYYATKSAKEAADYTALTTVKYKIPVELQELAKKVGINEHLLSTTRAQVGAEGSGCPFSTASGCYDPETHEIRLHVSAFTIDDPASTLAYEIAHYEWDILTIRDQLRPQLMAYYQSHINSNKEFRNNISSLSREGAVGSEPFYSEMFSITCTEVNPSELPQLLNSTCDSFLLHRDVLRKLY